MKRTLLTLASLLIASSAFAQVKVHVYPASPKDGFVTAESKALQTFTDKINKKLSKEKGIILAEDAAVSVEVTSHEYAPTSLTEPGLMRMRAQIYETHVQAVLRYGDYSKDIDIKASTAGTFPTSAETMFAYEIKTWVKDNAARLK